MVGVIVKVWVVCILVVLDGFICFVVVVILVVEEGYVFDYCVVGYVSVEVVYFNVFKVLGKELFLVMNMCLGEVLGGVLVINIVKFVVVCYFGMVIFVEVGVFVG